MVVVMMVVGMAVMVVGMVMGMAVVVSKQK